MNRFFLLAFFICTAITLKAQTNITEEILQAEQYYLEGAYDKANELFKKCIKNQEVDKRAKMLLWIKYSALLIDWQAYEAADSILQLAYGYVETDTTTTLLNQILLQQGHLLIEQKKYEEAEQLLTILLESSTASKAIIDAQVYRFLGEIYLETDQLEEAQLSLDTAQALLKYQKNNAPNLACVLLNHKGRLLSKLSQYEQAENCYIQAQKIVSSHPINYSDRLWLRYNQGVIQLEMGEFAKAEEILSDLEEIYATAFNNKPRYYHLLGKIGLLAEKIGDFQKAESYYQKVVTYFLKANDTQNYVLYSNDLALLLDEKLNRQEEAAEIYEKAIVLYDKNNGQENMIYASLINNLAHFYTRSKDYSKAESYYLKAKNILGKIVGKYDYGYASVIFNLAELQKKLGHFEEAEKYYLEVAEIDKATIGSHHPDYINYTLVDLGRFYEVYNKIPTALAYFQKANQGQLELIKNYYSTFEEQTRLNFLAAASENFNEYFSFLHRQRQSSISFVEAQTIQLHIKGLALDYFQYNRIQALTTKDSLLKKYYLDFQKERKRLSRAYAISLQEQQEANINLPQLKEKLSQLEKHITRRTQSLKEGINIGGSPSFDNLQSKLQDKQVSIDFINFQYYSPKERTDTTYYYALLSTKDNPSPQFIPLCTQKQLQDILQLSNKYGAGYTKYPEIGQKVYELVWQPLEPYLKNIHTIHLSPSGLLHKVAFGGLPYQDGHLLDQYAINYYGNLRDFISAQPAKIPKSIALAGGAYFDIDSTDLVKLAQEAEEFAFVKMDSIDSSTSIAAVSRAIASDSTRNAIEFNYLPGTKKEVEKLEEAFKEEGWQTHTYTGVQASEDNIKLLNGENAPGILHLATHGYFFNPFEKQEGITLSDETMRERIIGAESPLLRSGLVFSGVNHSWKGGKSIPGLEDGVLTAFEIANMELWNTELVVLSACETGLGDVESTEGVFGLQRAFKAAGVETLVISLWKIPDAQTAALMQLFYTHFLNGMPLADALRTAQLTMSEKYSPFYWAGFVLVE